MTTEAQERKPRSEWDRNCVAHCTSCESHFTGLAPFDAHRVQGECQEPSSVRFGEKSARAGEPVLQALSGRCAFMPGCWQNGKLVKRVEPVDIWQMSVRDIEQGALF